MTSSTSSQFHPTATPSPHFMTSRILITRCMRRGSGGSLMQYCTHVSFARCPTSIPSSKKRCRRGETEIGTRSSAWSALVTPSCLKRRGHSDLPDSLSKHSSPAKAAAAVVRDEVATTGAGGGVGNNNSSGTFGGSTDSPAGTQGSTDGGSNPGGSGDGRHHMPSGRCFRCRQRGHRKQDLQRGRVTSCLGAPVAQVLDMRRAPAHRTRRLW